MDKSTVLPALDSRSEETLMTLEEGARPYFVALIVAANAFLAPYGVTAKLISGERTYKQQDALYNQPHDGIDNDGDGRIDESDEFVTRARAGRSNHNFGIACDVGLFKGTKPSVTAKQYDVYLTDSPLYAKLGPIGEGVGLEWGGRWASIRDEPHYQIRTGKTLAQLRADVAGGRSPLSGVKLPPLPSFVATAQTCKIIVGNDWTKAITGRIKDGSAWCDGPALYALLPQGLKPTVGLDVQVAAFCRARGLAFSWDNANKKLYIQPK